MSMFLNTATDPVGAVLLDYFCMDYIKDSSEWQWAIATGVAGVWHRHTTGNMNLCRAKSWTSIRWSPIEETMNACKNWSLHRAYVSLAPATLDFILALVKSRIDDACYRT